MEAYVDHVVPVSVDGSGAIPGRPFSFVHLLKGYQGMESVLLSGPNSANIDINWVHLPWRLLSERLSCLALLLRIDAIPVIVTKSNMIVNNILCFN